VTTLKANLRLLISTSDAVVRCVTGTQG